MALQYIDKSLLGGYLSAAWQKSLGTNEDPANGQWYENGANGDGTGLYGGLTDFPVTQLLFDQTQQSYTPSVLIADSAIADNTNGLNPSSDVQLSYAYSNTQSSTHATSSSIKVGVEEDIKVSAEFFGIGGDSTTKFSADFTYSWSDSKTETTTQAQTFSQKVTMTPPKGKIYKAVLTASSRQIVVPYTAVITVKGTSETWFEDRINGHYNWMNSAGTLFGIINANALAGTDSHLYGADQNGNGVLTLSGTFTSQMTADFAAQIFDITNQSQSDGFRAQARMIHPTATAVPGGTLVKVIKFAQPALASVVAAG